MNERINIDYEGYITLSSPDGRVTYPLLKRIVVNEEEIEVNCIDSYVLSGGPQEAFESIVMTIPKKKLHDLSPDFEKTDAIVVGKSKISLKYIGYCPNMVITKCKLSSKQYTITAYHECEIVRGMTFKGAMYKTIKETIKDILVQIDTQLGYGAGHYSTPEYSSYITKDAEGTGSIGFGAILNKQIPVEEGSNLWTTLQQCALIMGCRVFFAGDKVYFVDYRLPFSKTEGIRDYFDLDIYNSTEVSPLYQSVISAPEYGEEGFDTVANSVAVKCQEVAYGDGSQKISDVFVKNKGSIESYGERNAQSIFVDNMDVETALVLGSTYIDYLIEPQQSISFTVKEVNYSNSVEDEGVIWEECFPKVTRVGKFIDADSGITLTNEGSTGAIYPQKLCLSKYERAYPDCTSTYSFGIMDTISLSQITSNIMTALGTKK